LYDALSEISRLPALLTCLLIPLLVGSAQGSTEEALQLSQAFGRKIDATSLLGQPSYHDEDGGNAQFTAGHYITETRWGRCAIEPTCHRIYSFRGKTSELDVTAHDDQGLGISSQQARQLAQAYARAAGFDVTLRLTEDTTRPSNYRRFTGVALLEGLPVFDSEVEIQVGHRSGSLQMMRLSFSTENTAVPVTIGPTTPSITAVDAAFAAARACELSGSYANHLLSGPELGFITPNEQHLSHFR
jgi:hypothetical protein